jgi:hypothetical protein
MTRRSGGGGKTFPRSASLVFALFLEGSLRRSKKILTNTFVSIIVRHDKTFVTGTIETSVSVLAGPVGAVAIVYFTLIYVCFEREARVTTEPRRKRARKEEREEGKIINFAPPQPPPTLPPPSLHS